MSVHITEAKFLLLEFSTTTLSPSIWHLKSVHITEAKFLLLEVSTTTLSPSGWHIDVSTHHWGQVSSARGQYYYFKSKYLTPSFYCKRLVLLPWDPIADKMMSVHITEAKFLLLEVSTTTLSPSIWHLKSVHITEAKFLLLEVSTTTLSPSGWHIDVSTHP